MFDLCETQPIFDKHRCIDKLVSVLKAIRTEKDTEQLSVLFKALVDAAESEGQDERTTL